jgi:hypothetical protein
VECENFESRKQFGKFRVGNAEKGVYMMLQKKLTVFKFLYIGNCVGWGNTTKVSG